ncbi:MAG: C25 family cysteine peptidase, partial [Phycisphaerae bacterium]
MQALEASFRAWGSVIVLAAVFATGVTGAAGEKGDGRGATGRGSGNYLIVIAEDYAYTPPMVQFINAKTAQGFDVLTYAVPAGTTNTAIKSYIASLWDTPAAPDYILLVGDTDGATSTSNTIPHWIGQGSRGSTTDLPYACMDEGDDWYPDIAIGRFSVRSVNMLRDVVNKTLYVEAGVFDDPDYVKRAAFLATNDMTSGAEETHDWVIENYMDPAEFQSIRIYARLGGGTQDIANAVNNGCLFVSYGGHSGSGGWSNPPFNQYDVQALTNAGLYGLVFGWSCNTAHYSYDECFGETWQRVANRGAAAYLSASDYIYWGDWDAWEPSRQ